MPPDGNEVTPDDVESPDMQAMGDLMRALNRLRATKPNDRSEKDRRYAVTITEMEKVAAYFRFFVIEGLT